MFIELIDIPDAIIEIVTSAGSKDPGGSFEEYESAFKKLGAGKVNRIHHDGREYLGNESLDERIKSAHGLFFAGGDQLKLTSIYGGTDLMYLIKQRYIHNRLVVAGTSAGAMALSTPMIYQGVGRDEMIAGNVKVTTGLEFMRDVCIDTHFVNRGRFVRMAQVIATNQSCICIGVEEDTAIIIENGTDARVVGCGVAIIIDGRNHVGTNVTKSNNNELITIRGLKFDILSAAEEFKIPQMNPPHQ